MSNKQQSTATADWKSELLSYDRMNVAQDGAPLPPDEAYIALHSPLEERETEQALQAAVGSWLDGGQKIVPALDRAARSGNREITALGEIERVGDEVVARSGSV